MKTPVLVRLCLMLLFLSWHLAVPVTLQESTPDDPPETVDVRKTALRFLDAYGTGDEAGLKSIAGNRRLDPFQVAHELLRLQLLSSGEKGDRLPAAIVLGKRVPGKRTRKRLLQLVRAWQAFTEEDRAREERLLAGLDKIRAANLAGEWNQATAISETLRNDLDQARNSMTAVLVRLAVVPALRNSGQANRAREALRLAAAGMKQISWDTGRAAARIIANPDSVKVKRPDRKCAFALLQISRTTGNLHGEWFAYLILGTLEFLHREYTKAALYHRRALETAERTGNRFWQGTSRMNLGCARMEMGELEAARSLLEQAAEDMEAAGAHKGSVNVRGNLANVLSLMGRYEEARETYDKVLETMESMKSRRGIAKVLENRGLVNTYSGFSQEALDDLERARKMNEEFGDRVRVKKILVNIGSVHHELGNISLARNLFEEAVTFFRKEGISYMLSFALGNLGSLFQKTGRYGKALMLYEEALRLTREPLAAAQFRKGIAVIHFNLGRKDAAVDHLRRAVKEFKGMGASRQVAETMKSLGGVYRIIGRYEEALACFALAERLMKKAGVRNVGASLLSEIAMVHFRQGRHEQALKEYGRACEIAITPVETAMSLNYMGMVLTKLGRNQEALEKLSRAADLVQDIGDHHMKVSLSIRMGLVHLRMGHPGKVMASAKQGLDILNRLGHGLSAEDRFGQRGWASMASDLGFRAAWRLLALKTDDRARILEDLIRIAEAGRGLLLVEELINREVLRDTLLPPGLRDAETRSRMRVRAIQKQLLNLSTKRSPDPAAIDQVRKALRAAYQDLEACISRVKREIRRVAAVLYPEPVQLRMLQQHLTEEEALVYFDMPTGEDRAFALVVTREKADVVRLGETGPIRDRLGRFLRLVTHDRSDERSVLAPGLYDSLLRPVEKAILEKKRLLISPDGVLAYLPFEALLRTEGERAERVIERWEVTYVPSATVLLSLMKDVRDKPEGRGVLALGDPVYGDALSEETAVGMAREASLRGLGKPRRLKESGKEVRELAKLFSAEERTVLLREEASVAGFKNALRGLPGRLAAIHLACHAHLDTLRPRLTGLVLSGREVLTLDDIFQLKIPADLAVLSACSTAQGKIELGEGVVGLVRGFFLAGCPRVVVSDWDVDDAITRRFMVAFYRNMFEGGLAPGAALRATKLDFLRNDPDRAHPAHWAAFVLWGLGK